MCETFEMDKTTLQKINAFASFCFFVIFFPIDVNGLEKCWKDSDCSDKNIYCLDGYCDGHCVPCQNFKREESASGCAKKLEFCGPCFHGTEAEDLTGGRKSERCKTIGMLVNSSSTETSDVNQWPTWMLMAIGAAVVSVFAATSFVYLYRGRMHLSTSNRRQNSKSTALTFNDPKKVVEPVELRNPPYNPHWDSISGNSETEEVAENQEVAVELGEIHGGSVGFSFFCKSI